ncbi:NRDE family protein [Flocculibacter collagenilyticus]|uniref:NRDE family protein n=1 Tax=Flocculibacter collagenilyticus TaxID=2744479 RepID=UPI0018F60E50|nr:NRDE family protein [Flocculibacter collagenilyticus]
MCTMSWFYHDDQLELFFNRDERNTRSKAIPPAVYPSSADSANNINSIYAKDPDGNGTWLGVNEQGLVVGLLNHYASMQQPISKQHLPTNAPQNAQFISRGQLVLDILNTPKNQLEQKLASINWLDYQACYLLILNSSALQSNAYKYIWDGKTLNHRPLPKIVSSSALSSEGVVGQRIKQYTQANPQTIEQHLAYHRSHLPTKGPMSVCMHHTEGQTQNLSHISVNSQQVTYRYWAGSPCQTEEYSTTCLKIVPEAVPIP